MQIRRLGRVDYLPTWQAMQDFTAMRVAKTAAETADELWLLEHPPVFTLGQAGRREHILVESNIAVVPIDRGGQVTYHGPGQVVVYVLLDLKRRGYGVKALVHRLEQAVVDVLASQSIVAVRHEGAPGVYVEGAKVAALGLRVRNGCTYHGLSLNVDMDMQPFSYINPCGYAGLAVTQTKALGSALSPAAAGELLLDRLQQLL